MLDLYEFKRHYALRGKDIVSYLIRYYPQFDKTAESKCSHFEKSGVCLTAEAEALLRAKFEAERYRKRKPKTEDVRIQIRTRVTDDLHSRFRKQLERNSTTAQAIITELVTVWTEAMENVEKVSRA